MTRGNEFDEEGVPNDPDRFRPLLENELVMRGDLVEDAENMLITYDGPTGFRAKSETSK
jgi:hypothetical protein